MRAPKRFVAEAAKHLAGMSAFVVYENSHAVVFLDKHPINAGHLLVIPRFNVASFYKLDEKPFIELMLVVRRMASVIEAVYQPMKVGSGSR